MKIEFYSLINGNLMYFQEEFCVKANGDVYEMYIHDIYGYGDYLNKDVCWRVVE